MITIKVDIVGGSLSGLSAAISLKENNKDISVFVHEKYKEIGYNHEGRRCGEAHSVEGIWKKWKPVGKSIFNDIKAVETIVGDKKYILQKPLGTFYMLNRQEFICQLARDAEKLGAEIISDDKIKSVDDLDGEYIIDASGCPSSIKRELGFNKGIKGITYQQTLEDSNKFFPDVIKVFFTEAVGYYWLFPRDPEKKEVNLGIGVVGKYNCNLKEMLETFKEEQKIEGKINYVTGGLIPAGLQRPLRHKNILFVGDAGVGTFPVLGQGIYRALLSGDIVGKCIANGHPEKYSKLIYQNFINWEIIGKTFLIINYILSKIGKKAMFAMHHRYLDFWYSFH